MANQSFRRIIEVLDRHGVEYVVVGGVAAVLQGAPVTTFDLDALIRVNDENASRLADALASLDARFREHLDLRPVRADLLAGGHCLLITDSGPFDVLGRLGGGLRYEDVVDGAVPMTLDGLSIKVLGITTLIEEKRKLGRDKDLAAVRLLEAVLRKRSERG